MEGDAGRRDDRVLVSMDESVATITLSRPKKLNAIDPAMLADLEAVLERLDRDRTIRVVLVTGAGDRAFCVGADIHAWTALEPMEMWRSWVREGHRVFDRLAALRQPTIAVVNGYALGGGLELALAADLRLAAAAAQFAMPETTLATLPGWAGTSRLPATIGVARAKQMIFTGARIDAATAERWGLVNETVPGEQLSARVAEVAETIAANAPIAVQLAKGAIDGGGATIEAVASALAATSADGQEGVAAFREKRAPHFTGR